MTPPRAAPAPDEQPRGEGRGMGLGGALYPRHANTPPNQALPRQRSFLGPFYDGFLFPGFHTPNRNEDNADNRVLEADRDVFRVNAEEGGNMRNIHNNAPHGHWARIYRADEAQAPGAMDRILQRQAPDYKQSFTHPPKPGSGFTFDFGPSEAPTTSPAVASSSKNAKSVEAGTILVCGCCMDPLVMNVTGSIEETKDKRIWGLRCGHMIDGKCIEKVMKPAPPPSKPSLDLDKTIDISSSDPPEMDGDIEQTSSNSSKGKGKAKATFDPEEYAPFIEVSSSSPLRPISPQPLSHYNLRSHHATAPHNEMPGSFRSVLRPNSPVAIPSTSSAGVVPPAPVGRRGRGRRGRGRGARGRKDYKGKARAVPAPVIEEIYEWPCPVAGCGRVHRSNKIEGEWKMDEMKDMGAIPIYV